MPADQRKRLTAPRPVALGVRDLEAALDELTPRSIGAKRKDPTAEQVRLLLKHRARGVTWHDLMGPFGVSENTLRRWYREAAG